MILKEQMNKSIEMLNEIWDYITEHGLANSQDCLNWLDKINEISIRN